MASAGRDALTECGEIIKRVRTYRARADGCEAGSGRVTMTGCAPRDDGYEARDDGSTVPEDGSAARDDGSATRDDGYGSLKKTGDDRYTTPDDGYRVGRRRVLPGQRWRRLRDDG